MLRCITRLAAASLIAATGVTSAARAQSETFDKPVTIYVAGTAGGGIDLLARALARHMGKYLPGAPNVVVQDMPGAGGIRAANFLAEAAPRDGTAIGTFAGGPVIEPLIGARNPGYDMSKFTWVGAVSKDVGVCLSWGTTSFRTVEDLRDKEMIVAGTGAGSDSDTYPIILNEVLNTKIKLITGYLGTKETIMAIESGEAHGRCSVAWSALKMARPDWLRDKKINVIMQFGLEKSRELPDVPLVLDYVKNTEDRQLMELLMGTMAVARPFMAPPGVPEGRATALRRAFDKTMKDEGFLAEAKQLQLDVEPTTGEDSQKIVQSMYATPRAVVERAKKLLSPN
jgi:tripartite-type tricarboxylate transporter receptor subunit TctC